MRNQLLKPTNNPIRLKKQLNNVTKADFTERIVSSDIGKGLSVKVLNTSALFSSSVFGDNFHSFWSFLEYLTGKL